MSYLYFKHTWYTTFRRQRLYLICFLRARRHACRRDAACYRRLVEQLRCHRAATVLPGSAWLCPPSGYRRAPEAASARPRRLQTAMAKAGEGGSAGEPHQHVLNTPRSQAQHHPLGERDPAPTAPNPRWAKPGPLRWAVWRQTGRFLGGSGAICSPHAWEPRGGF